MPISTAVVIMYADRESLALGIGTVVDGVHACRVVGVLIWVLTRRSYHRVAPGFHTHVLYRSIFRQFKRWPCAYCPFVTLPTFLRALESLGFAGQ